MNPRPPEIPPHKLIATLRNFNLLPAIVFLPTRRKCDEAALEVANDKSQPTDIEKQKTRQEIFESFVGNNPEIRRHKHSKLLVTFGVASHHAGHIPSWKLIVERMMSAGLLNAIFATSTVAAGVDFPARTVVITNADTRGNDGWRPIGASELQQMVGRAGRRGKDNVGFVVAAPGQFQNPRRIADLLKGPPDALESKFRATYTTLLNLLDAFGNFAQVREIVQKSFAFRDTSAAIEKLEREIQAESGKIESELNDAAPGVSLNELVGFERLTSSRIRSHEMHSFARSNHRHEWLVDNAIAGRIFSQGKSSKNLCLIIREFGDRVSAMREDGRGTTVSLEQISRIHKNIYPLKEAAIDRAFAETHAGKNPVLRVPNFKESMPDPATDELFQELIQAFGSAEVQTELWKLVSSASALEKKKRDIESLYRRIWNPFDRKAKVLDHFGYITFADEKISESGKWLADLRVDRSLLVGEAVSRGFFDKAAPTTLAGLMAALAADSDRNYGELNLSDDLVSLLGDFEEVVFDVSNAEWKAGVEASEDLNFSAAAAAERWASGVSWEEIVRETHAEEGDLFRLFSRTAEALNQIGQVKTPHREASERSRTAAAALLREPVR